MLLGAAPPAKPRVAFSAPAAYKPTGKLPEGPFTAILPNGRVVRPAGKSVALDQRPLGLALARGGAYAVVAGAGRNGAPGVSVVDLATMTEVTQSRVTLPRSADAVAVLRDVPPTSGSRPPADRELVVVAPHGTGELDLYDLAPDGTLSADVTPKIALQNAPDGATALAVSADETSLYAIGSGGVQAIDVAARAPVGAPAPVGVGPTGATRAGSLLAVVNAGVPESGSGYDLNASSVSLVQTAGAAPASVGQIPLDGALDPLVKVGGVQPSAVTATAKGALFVSLANADRVDVFETKGSSPRYGRVAAIDLSLYHDAPFGTAPDALALAPGGKRLYAALAGMNAVAVIDVADPRHPRRLGLIPTGWFPTAVSFSRLQGSLVVTNAFGDGTAGTLQLIPLDNVRLDASTMTALGAARVERPIGTRDPVVPAAPALGRSRYLAHVVYISLSPSTYDATFGDLTDAAGRPDGAGEPGGSVGDPALTEHGQSKTPNLHALAARYGIAANLYALSRAPALAREAALGGVVTVVTARRAIAGGGVDALAPGDFPRFGFLYNNLARHHISFRLYGDPSWLSILAGNVDRAFLAAGDDEARAKEFVSDYGALAASGRAPAFADVHLGGEDIAAEDRAVGTMVAALSREPTWNRTVVIVAPRGVAGNDHVNALRAYALVIGPMVKPHYVGRLHLSYASILKTEEEILGLPALSLGDLLSSDLADFFSTTVHAAPYVAVGPPFGPPGAGGQGSPTTPP